MIDKKMQDAMNKQINAEFFSGYLYLAMAIYFESIDLEGFAHWMKIQAQEEVTHSLKLYKHIMDRGGKVILDAIGTPQASWESPLAAFEAAYQHEKKITALLNELTKFGREIGDYASESLLRWFIDEQVEEETNVERIVNRLKLVGESGQGIFMIDQELKQRSELFTATTSTLA